jgi:esterase
MKLHCEAVASGHPERWAFVLHGVFGSAANWRLFMRQLVKERPDWGFLLVDLRGHARSLGGEPPHTIEALAADLDDTADRPIDGVIGHSLGGKVALAFASRHENELAQVWSLDSQPGTREGESSPTDAVLALLERLPSRFEARDDFVATLRAEGQPKAVASWLAMNLRRDDDGYRLALDLPTLRAVLDDFWARDLWPELARRDDRRALHVVVGGASFVWRKGDRERLEALPIELHVLEGAGHWVHVDAAEAMLALMRQHL